MKDGWYWFRSDDPVVRVFAGNQHGWEMVEVVNCNSGPRVGTKRGRGTYHSLVVDMPGRYVGPIEEPELTDEDPE